MSNKFDLIIIGAGVVGCAMARQFTLQGHSVIVLEKGFDILDGASKGNSAILHTGFDAPTGSIEHACIVEGYKQYLSIRKELNLPLLKSGALVAAWTDEQESNLPKILNKAHKNGISDAAIISQEEAMQKEPELSNKIKAAVHIPREFVIDPWTAPFAYLMQAIENGAEIMRKTEVLSGEYSDREWSIVTSQCVIKGRAVINCAGLYGDKLDKLLVGHSDYSIHPRKGQFIVYDKAAQRLIESIILPVPTSITKGVVVCRTIFGNLLVGPTAEDQIDRDDASVKDETLKMLVAKGEQIIPALKNMPITATFAGIRPATEFKDYCINSYPDTAYISVGGIRSTGLSAALGIAKYVFDRYQGLLQARTALSHYKVASIIPINETQTRDWQLDGNEGIVCHCESVTKREITTALSGPMPAASIEGLKRRTRATMGRCQGFYCTAQLASLTKNRFDNPLTVTKETGD